MMNPVPWLQMTNMISYQGLVRTFLKATSAMSNQHKAFCDGILKTASSKVTRLQRDATVRILEAQTKRNKAITAASEAIEVVQSMGGL
ncbi:hypothetical protein [Klebsiella michiganensis]|uniref:hypothetical protein n=1 Tax=Klebsiella michiganensis TaxID=1134687 RepID=UPI001D0CE562|nr:hypothetical protein [Klebsiella michiganensis]